MKKEIRIGLISTIKKRDRLRSTLTSSVSTRTSNSRQHWERIKSSSSVLEKKKYSQKSVILFLSNNSSTTFQTRDDQLFDLLGEERKAHDSSDRNALMVKPSMKMKGSKRKLSTKPIRIVARGIRKVQLISDIHI